MINRYFKKVKDKIDEYNHIISDSNTNEKTYSEKRGFIGGKVNFSDDSRLDFAEVKDVEIEEKIKYRYHYMNSDNEMKFRYDNAKHHPDIETFPHHKHTSDCIKPSNEPKIGDVLSEIERQVVKNE